MSGSHLPDMDLRVRALESVLVEKGYIDPAALDAIIDTYETRIGPRNGARVVARSWVDPQFHGADLAFSHNQIHGTRNEGCPEGFTQCADNAASRREETAHAQK